MFWKMNKEKSPSARARKNVSLEGPRAMPFVRIIIAVDIAESVKSAIVPNPDSKAAEIIQM
jgi:hypothetical protein